MQKRLKKIQLGTDINVNVINNIGMIDNILGNCKQDGEPTLDSPSEVISIGENGNIDIKINNDNYNLSIQEPLRKIGNYIDGFARLGNQWYEQHFIKELILTGDENWSKSLNEYPTYILQIQNSISKEKKRIM